MKIYHILFSKAILFRKFCFIGKQKKIAEAIFFLLLHIKNELAKPEFLQQLEINQLNFSRSIFL